MNVDYEEFKAYIDETILFHEEKPKKMTMTSDKLYVMDRMTALVNNGKGLIQLLEEDIEASFASSFEAKLASKLEAKFEANVEKERQKAILNFHHKLNLPNDAISQVMELPLDYVKSIIDAHKMG